MRLSGRGLLASSVFAPVLYETIGGSQSLSGNTLNKKSIDTIPGMPKPLDDQSEKPKAPAPSALPPDKRIGYAIVGLGHLALENILPAFAMSTMSRPVALVSGHREKAEQVAQQYGIETSGIYSYENFDQIKNNKKIDAVYIVLPNSMHAEFTSRAAKAGKHVLCEKPMAVSSREAQQMIDDCKKAAKKLMVAYRIQYEPHHKMIREWVRANKFGKTRVIEMYNGQNIGDPQQWRLKKNLAGGGSLPDIGLYCLNTARYLTGEEPVWLNASTYTTPGDMRFSEVEETVMFQLRFPGGTLINATCSYATHESRRYRCLADKGAWFGMDPAFSYTGLKMELDEVNGNNTWTENPVVEQKDQFAVEIDHFSDCIMNDKRPFTPGEEGLQDQMLMEAIYRSAKNNQPITLVSQSQKDIFRGSVPVQQL